MGERNTVRGRLKVKNIITQGEKKENGIQKRERVTLVEQKVKELYIYKDIKNSEGIWGGKKRVDERL